MILYPVTDQMTTVFKAAVRHNSSKNSREHNVNRAVCYL